MRLIGNCRHGSEIAVYSAGDRTPPFLRKAASTPDGIADLRREWSGWQWYVSRCADLQRLPAARRQERPSYMRVDFPWVAGNKGCYEDGISRNRGRIQDAMDHYLNVWPKEQFVPMHGDFSIDNLLFDGTRVAVVDWEHFSAENTPWGFDVLHLIFETLWFDVQAGHALPPLRKIIAPWLEQLSRHALLDVRWRQSPLAQLSAWMTEHSDRWGAQFIRFPRKFPVLRFSPLQIQATDAWFH